MNAQHTQGQLRAGPNGGYGLGPVNAIFIAESEVCGELIARLDTNPPNPNVEADARRLVACWNRLEQFSTEQIEDMGFDLAGSGALYQELWNMQRQRNNLLVALQEIETFMGADFDDLPMAEKARAAIANATNQAGTGPAMKS
jgi:hypothetical protein